MFPGQGSQYAGMCKDLYCNEPVFRKQLDEGFAILKELTNESFIEVWLHGDEATINNTRYAQPLVFLMEYSLAVWLGSVGIHPQYMIGHSIGEYVAACISGVFTFKEALRVVVKRGELMSRVAPGAMLSVPVSADGARRYINEKISLAAVNGPEQVVLSGDPMAVAVLMEQLSSQGIPFVKLHTSHAFHSAMQETIMAEFEKELEQISFGQMSVPFISNLTGHYISTQLARSPDYWVQHMRKTVQFSQGLQTLLSVTGDLLFIEAGAGHTLSALLKQQGADRKLSVVNIVRTIKENADDQHYLSEKLGRLWTMGAPVNWNAYYNQQKRKRISLPTYSFEPVKYPVEVNPLHALPDQELVELTGKSQQVKDWFYRVCWKQADWLHGSNRDYANSQVLIFADEQGLGDRLMEALNDAGAHCTMVKSGAGYAQTPGGSYTITPGNESDYNRLFSDLSGAGITPAHIIHTWSYGVTPQALSAEAFEGVCRETGYRSLLHIARNFPDVFGAVKLDVWVIGNGWYKVLGDEIIYPGKCTALAAVKVIPQEFQHLTCRAIDMPDLSPAAISALMKELHYITEGDEIAIRGRKRFIKDFEKIRFSMPVEQRVFREKGTYLITGASGGVGTWMAGFLAANYRANLILLSRSKIKEELIDELRKKGSQVIGIQSNIADSASISAPLAAAEQTLGSIHGIIHAAGMADHGGVILRRSQQDDELVFEPKITGTDTLCKLFANRTLDFMLNCSSGAASIAPFGQIAYVASNIYQDAVAEQDGRAFPVISIEWPPLREIGMAVNAIRHLSAQEQAAYLQYAINPADMVQIMSAAIYLQVPVQVISKRDFGKLYRNSRKSSKTEDVTTMQQQARERPVLSSQYKTPETPTEEKLAVLMQQLLGIDKAGIDDAFFELGGDSLRGMILLRHIRKEFNVDLPLKELFENQTIRKMGAVIDAIGSLTKITVRTSRITI
jgi:acyl transferase domain-containing protein